MDSDKIVRELLTTDQEVKEQIRARWGKDIFNDQNEVDRARLAAIVFHDESALKHLEQLLHPRVREVWTEQIKASTDRNWVVEIPLLFENNLETCFDYVIAVFVSETEQVQRLLQKGFSRETISARLKRQWPVLRKAELADFVVLNQGNLGFLEEQAEHFLNFIQNRC